MGSTMTARDAVANRMREMRIYGRNRGLRGVKLTQYCRARTVTGGIGPGDPRFPILQAAWKQVRQSQYSSGFSPHLPKGV